MTAPLHHRQRRRPRGERGYALLLVFAMLSAAAVMFYLEAPRMVMQSQRGKEQLLIDRGEQYQRAIQLYYRKLKTWPQSLDDLEKGNNMRFLRRRYLDPFTGKAEWRLVHISNGQYTDSQVYNQKEKKEKPQVFVAEQASIGTNPTGADADAVNQALVRRASDKTAPNPLDALPEGLRGLVDPRLLNMTAEQRARLAQLREQEAREEADYAKQTLPTPGVAGFGQVNTNGINPNTPQPSDMTAEQNAAYQAALPTPGASNMSFAQIQQAQADAARQGITFPNGANQAAPANGFISNQPTQPYGTPTPGANGLSYTSIVGNDPANSPYGAPGAPQIPGTTFPGAAVTTTPYPGANAGLPSVTGIVPPAPPFGSPQYSPQPVAGGAGGTCSSFIGGCQGTTNTSSTPVTGATPGLGAQQGGGAGGGFNSATTQQPGGVAGSNAASDLLNGILTTPRGPAAAPGGSAAGGSGLVGVASKYNGQTVKVYREKSKFQHWEFIYDPAKDTSGRKPGAAATPLGAPLPGGLPPGTATDPNSPSSLSNSSSSVNGGFNGPSSSSTIPVGTRFPAAPGFGNPGGTGSTTGGVGAGTGSGSSSGGGGGFIGGGGGFIGGGSTTTPTTPTIPATQPGAPGTVGNPGGGGLVGQPAYPGQPAPTAPVPITVPPVTTTPPPPGGALIGQ